MTTTGDIIAGTGTSVTRGAGTAWTNPGNITANDGTTTSCVSGSSGSAYLRASNFGFNLPANSLIQGFTVKVEMAESSTGSETVSVQLVGAAGTAIGTAKTFSANGTTLTVYTTGTATDLWGTTGLTATDINDTDFGVYVWYTTTHSTTVDYISIDVNYEPPRSGSLAATETGSDTFSASGDVIVSGALSATETGSDTFSASGTVTDAAITGSLAATEVGADTASIEGDVIVQGSLAATETGSDTFSASGTVTTAGVSGSLSVTETGTDTFSASGTVTAAGISGSLAATETGSDTFSSSGTVLVKGTANLVETGLDGFTSTGKVLVSGSLSVTETGADIFSAAGITITSITGSMAAVESGGAVGFGVNAVMKYFDGTSWVILYKDPTVYT